MIDLDKWQFNLDKFTELKSEVTREMVRNMFHEMISMYNGAHHSGNTDLKQNSEYKTAIMMFNTLLSNGYLISQREKTLDEVLD